MVIRFLKSPYYQIGGLKLVFQRKRDQLLKRPDKTDEYLYKIFQQAESKDYRRLLHAWCRIHNEAGLNNIEHPKTFNEKIQWLKLYDSSPMKTLLADKYLGREWIKKQIGEEYVVPIIGVWDSFDDIDFDKLPQKFVLKCNHGSGWNCIVEDKSKLDLKRTKQLFDRWMGRNFAFTGLEFHYKNIPPKIIAEEYLEGGPIKDFRFFCFNGLPKQVWVDLYSGTSKHIRSIFDMDWNKLPMRCTWPDGGDLLLEKPEKFDLMVEFSKKLSKAFAFVRVDFFEVDGKLYVGEMTFTPMNGRGRFEPHEWDSILGDWLVLPKEKHIFKG